MKTYAEVVELEGRRALSKGYMGEGTEPDYIRVNLIAEIFEKSTATVRRDIIKSRDLPATYRKVSGRSLEVA